MKAYRSTINSRGKVDSRVFKGTEEVAYLEGNLLLINDSRITLTPEQLDYSQRHKCAGFSILINDELNACLGITKGYLLPRSEGTDYPIMINKDHKLQAPFGGLIDSDGVELLHYHSMAAWITDGKGPIGVSVFKDQCDYWVGLLVGTTIRPSYLSLDQLQDYTPKKMRIHKGLIYIGMEDPFERDVDFVQFSPITPQYASSE